MPAPPSPKIPCLPRLADDDTFIFSAMQPGTDEHIEQGSHQQELGLHILEIIRRHQLELYKDIEELVFPAAQGGSGNGGKDTVQRTSATGKQVGRRTVSSGSDFESNSGSLPDAAFTPNLRKELTAGQLSPVQLDVGLEAKSDTTSNTSNSGGSRASGRKSVSSKRSSWDKENEDQFQTQLKLNSSQTKLDFIVGIVIVANAACMMVQLEWQGSQSAKALGLFDSQDWGVAEEVFQAIEHVFTIFYVGELTIRLRQEGCSYFCQAFNLFDFVLVVFSALELWLLAPALGSLDSNVSSANVSELRSIRLIKIVKVARLIRAVRLLHGLRQLVTACFSALTALFWSVILLFLCIATASLTLGSLLQDFIQSSGQDYDERKWIWEHYGTALRATLTLFEMTFAGNWPVYSRPVLEYAGGWYMIIFATYILVVVFATTRVIGAIFLKDALDATNSDPELMIHAKEMQRVKYMEKLADFFYAIDTTNDGNITRAELENMLSSPKVVAYLAVLDIELHEGSKLFDMLDDGDGNVTYKEFINGLFRFRGQARSVDLVELHMKMQYIEDVLTEKLGGLAEQIAGEVHATQQRAKRRSHRRFTRMIHEEAQVAIPIQKRLISDSSVNGGTWTTPVMSRFGSRHLRA